MNKHYGIEFNILRSQERKFSVCRSEEYERTFEFKLYWFSLRIYSRY